MKILLFFHGGSKNRGCEAIIRAAIPIIKKAMPQAVINIASFDPESDQHFDGINTIYDTSWQPIKRFTWHWLISFFYVKFMGNEDYAHKVINRKLIDLVPNHDVFLSVGGDNYCYGEQPWVYVIDRFIKSAGKKLVLWGASIGEEDLSEAKINDLKQFDLLLVRESLTYEILKSKGITKVQLCADGAFIMQKEELPLPEGWQIGNTIGFNYSPLVWKMNPNSKDAVVTLMNHLLATTEMTICLTPHVILPDNDDYLMLKELKELFSDDPRIILLPNNLNALQYKGYIARMRFFIGARTHATIAAYSNHVPTMVLGYSVKSKGIAKDLFGYERLVLGLNELSDSSKMCATCDALLRDEIEIKTILNNRIPEIQKMAFKAGELLREIL